MARSVDHSRHPNASAPPQLMAGLCIGGRPYLPLVALLLLLNGLVLINALLHDPRVGYDAGNHLRYLAALASGRLVTPEDSGEFFSPPLPYVFPALVMGATHLDLYWAAKLGQLLNVLLSIATSLYVLRICHLINPEGRSLKLGALGFLAILPVYYKTFSYVRGEPYVTVFATAAAYYAIRALLQRTSGLRDVVPLGIALGCAALSRQWGILLVPGLVVVWALAAIKETSRRHELTKALAITLSVSFVISAWFYLSLDHRYDSMTAFNRKGKPSFALSNQGRSFYVGLGLPQLFTDPIRSAFPNQLLPIFYSEMWGDYWGYFVVFGRDNRSNEWLVGPQIDDALAEPSSSHWLITNRRDIAAYLGRVNAVSTLPTLLAVAAVLSAGVAVGRFLRTHRPDRESSAQCLLFVLLCTSYAGYLWFLIMYPSPGKGDTIKATYMLHTFPFVAVLVGCLFDRLGRIAPRLQIAAAAVLVVTFLHNLPAMLTRFTTG